ncbi:tyrosinase [Mycena albidolilacea]|uniref:tyrosinase n=1 Tax=Mycena albidolilacea TaxID=1033008 RepID=A0AAD7EMG0_9AGAR|nr:tyrosinase [Mycena albidolilacea]
MSTYIITGAKGGTPPQGAAAPNRVEIHNFVKIDDQFSLYIQALQKIYGQNQPDVDSFFSIGGIHGLPYQVWDGSGTQPADPNAWEGYCTHGNVLFPTWHRPYMGLYEQALQRAAIAIAATYTVNKAQFQAAALTLRQPYWDWASNAVPPPEVISLAKVTITTANGQRVQVDNPLRRYTFHPIDPSFPAPYSSWKTTLRQPTTTGPNAVDNVAVLTSTLVSAQRQITSKTYNLLTRVHTWPAFSNHTPGDGGSTSNSLEAIHDGIHVDVGGNGQMSDPSVAAFDPIFFLHHANVDRLVSLWSALNPGVWVTPGEATGGTWTLPEDTPVDKTSDLTPFWNSQTTYWKSTAVTTTATVLGYTYPEFNGLDLNNPAAVRTAIAAKVNQLYGTGIARPLARVAAPKVQAAAAAAPTPTSHSSAAAGNAAPHVHANLAQAPVAHQNPAPGHAASSNPPQDADFSHVPVVGQHAHNSEEAKLWEWTARVQVKKYEVGGSFSVELFLGDVPSDPAHWRTSPNFIGAHQVFANSVPDRCANCRTHRDAEVEGFVHLNDGIVEHSGLDSLEPDVVVPYLKTDLHWRIQKAGGEAVDIGNVPSLEVAVFATPLTFPPDSDFPVPGERQRHHEPTTGRPGGSRAA